MIHFIQQHLVIACMGLYFMFSNAVGAMEKPDEKSGAFYRYIYRLSHGLAGNLKYALQSKFPQYVEADKIT